MDRLLTAFFLRQLWPGPLLWMVLHSLDYYLTVAAVSYRKRQGDRIRFEGSMEVNPLFQKAVEAGARLPKRFVVTLLFMAGLTFLVAALIRLVGLLGDVPAFLPDLFGFLMGVMLFSRISVIGNHLAILFRIRLHTAPHMAKGELVLSRRAAILPGVVQCGVQATLLAFATLLSPSWWLAGGVFGVAGIGGFYLRMGLKAPRLPPEPKT